MKLLGYKPMQDDEPAWRKTSFWGGTSVEMKKEENKMDEHEKDEDKFFTPSKDIFSHCVLEDVHCSNWHIIPKHRKVRDQEWLLLARLLKKIPNLGDVVYACTHRIPPCLLAAFNRRPNTRLHIHTFNLDDFADRRCLTHDDDTEYLAPLWPCLHSIVVLHTENDYYRNVNNPGGTALSNIRIAAPRLRHVRVARCPLPSSAECIHRPPVAGGMWYNANRESIRLPPTHAMSGQHVHNLILDMFDFRDSRTEFFPLHSLEIQEHVKVDVIQKLTQISKEGGLRSIHTLALWMTHTDVTQPSIDEAASLLLETVPPLKDLKLIGPVANRTFAMILSHHGETLRKLQFIPTCKYLEYNSLYFVSPFDIHELSKRCLKLEQVELRTRRTQGDEKEMKFYHALGTLRRLKKIILHLDCSPPKPSGSKRLTWYKRAELHIRESLVNCAIDSTLAQSIFLAMFPTGNTTTTATTTTTIYQQVPTLELQPLVDGSVDGLMHNIEFYCMLYNMAKCWAVSVRRDASDNTGKGLATETEIGTGPKTETGMRIREIQKPLMADLKPDLRMYYGGDWYERAWTELWPPKNEDDKRAWWDKWWSFPLVSESVRDWTWEENENGNGKGKENGNGSAMINRAFRDEVLESDLRA